MIERFVGRSCQDVLAVWYPMFCRSPAPLSLMTLGKATRHHRASSVFRSILLTDQHNPVQDTMHVKYLRVHVILDHLGRCPRSSTRGGKTIEVNRHLAQTKSFTNFCYHKAPKDLLSCCVAVIVGFTHSNRNVLLKKTHRASPCKTLAFTSECET